MLSSPAFNMLLAAVKEAAQPLQLLPEYRQNRSVLLSIAISTNLVTNELSS